MNNKSEIELLETVDENGITLLEKLVRENYDFDHMFFSDPRSCNIFYKNGRIDLLNHCRADALLSSANLNETYLDVVLDEYAKDKEHNKPIYELDDDYELGKDYPDHTYSASDEAKILIAFVNHGLYGDFFDNMIEGLMNFDSNHERLIDKIIEYDKNAVYEIIGEDNINEIHDINLYLHLTLKKIYVSGDIFNSLGHFVKNDFFEKLNSPLDSVKVSPYEEEKLNELREIFLSDGSSDEDLVNTLIRSYKKSLDVGSSFSIREIELLISIKRNNPDFKLVKDYSCYYLSNSKTIALYSQNINSLNHELGHAFFSCLADKEVPSNYEKIVESVRNNPNILSKITEFKKTFNGNQMKVKKYVDGEYFQDYEEHLSDERKREIKEFLNKTREKKIEEYLELGYEREEIETLLDDNISYEQYIIEDRRITTKEMVRALSDLYIDYGAISDIIDSIFVGKFVDGKIKDINGDIIYGCSGHGISYYERGIEIQFNEVIAEFSELLKSSYYEESLKYLREIVGDEYVDFILDYYENKIINSQKYDVEMSK